MFELLVCSPALLDVGSFEHPVLSSLVVSRFLHTVVVACVIFRTSGPFTSMIQNCATRSLVSIMSVLESVMRSV